MQQLIFECRDGRHIQLVLGVPGAVAKLYAELGIDKVVDPADRGAPDPARGARDYFAEYDLIAAHVARFDRDDLLARVRAAGLGVEPVLDPGECWDDEQILRSALIQRSPDGVETVGCPVTVLPGTGDRAAPRALPGGGGPLAGLRVVDLGAFVAGPLTTRLLGDLGAEVVKVDPPRVAPSITSLRQHVNANRGKAGVCVDLKSAAGRAVVDRLVGEADVVVHNFRVGVASRLGVDPDRLERLRPGLVTLETSAYGQAGPRAADTGFDMVLQAFTGLEQRCAGRDGLPHWPRSPIVDYATAGLGAVAVLAALHERERTGHAVRAQVDLARTALFLLSDVLRAPGGAVVEGPTLTADMLGFGPAERLYRARDGWIAVAARTPGMAEALACTLDLHTPLGDPAGWGADESAAVAEAIGRWPAGPLVAALHAAGVWCAPAVADGWADLRGDPAARDRGLLVDLDDSRYGTVTGWLGALVTFSRSESFARPTASAPEPGDDTDRVLRAHGYGDREIASLREAAVVSGGDAVTGEPLRRSVEPPGLAHGNLPIPAASRVGDLIATGGVRGIDPATGRLGATAEEQCALMLGNVVTIVRAAGGTADTIVRIDVVAVERGTRTALDAEWIRHFPDPDSRPARHLTVHDLPGGMLVQATAWAVAASA